MSAMPGRSCGGSTHMRQRCSITNIAPTRGPVSKLACTDQMAAGAQMNNNVDTSALVKKNSVQASVTLRV